MKSPLVANRYCERRAVSYEFDAPGAIRIFKRGRVESVLIRRERWYSLRLCSLFLGSLCCDESPALSYEAFFRLNLYV